MTWKLFFLLLRAAETTIVISAMAICMGVAWGTVVCVGRLSKRRAVAILAQLYISFFRGVPMLVQLLLTYNLLPQIGLNIPSEAAAVLSMAVCTAAYQAENIRGGMQSVPEGLLEAATVVGMSRWQQFRRIRLPVAFRLTLPAVINEAISILQASALVSVIGVVELSKTAQDLSASTFRPLPLYAMAGALYLVMNYALAGGGALAERLIGSGRK